MPPRRHCAKRCEELYTLAVRATNDLVWDWDVGTDRLAWNEALYTSLGYRHDEVPATLQWWVDAIHPDDREATTAHLNEVVESGEEQFTAEYRFRSADGTYRHMFDRGYIVRDEQGRPVRGVGAMQDITARRDSELAAARSEAITRSILEASPDCISVLDRQGIVLFSNKAAANAYGLPDDKLLVGRPWGHRLDAKGRAGIEDALASAADGCVPRLSLKVRGVDGDYRWYESLVSPIQTFGGESDRLLVMSRDITEHKAAERNIRWAANHDPLTRLPNRALFQQRLDDSISGACRGRGMFALLMVDLDKFKHVNDRFGHDAGDAVLCAASRRIQEALRKEDIVARVGGDEFAVLIKNPVGPAEVKSAADKIARVLKQPFAWEGRLLDCCASIGASIFGSHGSCSSDLLKNADVALYAAKARGRAKSLLFKKAMRSDVQKRLRMLELARDAIENDLIRPYYQPQVDLRTGQVVAFEALLRVRKPGGGNFAPAQIAAALEDVELAGEIGDRMAEKVIADVATWIERGVEFGHVAINAAAADFQRGDFAERILSQLRRYSVPPGYIHVEVTETVFMGGGADCVRHALELLSAQGIRIALDDFGTGFASLSHLQQFPIGVIKIDRSFVRDMSKNKSDAAIVKAVLNLGESLGLDVVAEGVETLEQELRLMAEQCRFVQGYRYGKAVAASQVPRIIRSRNGLIEEHGRLLTDDGTISGAAQRWARR